jgi:hypothetical protein
LNRSKETPHFFGEPEPLQDRFHLIRPPKRGRQSRQRRALE